MSSAPALVPADGPLLQRILDTADEAARGGLSPAAFGRFDAALRRTPWGERHLRRLAWVSHGRLLAGARVSDRLATLDGQTVRLRGIGDLRPDPDQGSSADAEARLESFLDALLDDGRTAGADYALLHLPATAPVHVREHWVVLPTMDVELQVAEPVRYGAPMMLVRAGEDRDYAFIATIDTARAETARLALVRDPGFVRHAVTRARLLAGLAAPGTRQLQFVVTEEGMRAAAYLVISIVGDQWTIEACGDRDPSGARLGGMLQALLAIERVAQRPTIRGWLPPGLAAPQLTVTASAPSTDRLVLIPLTAGLTVAPLTAADVCVYRSDLP